MIEHLLQQQEEVTVFRDILVRLESLKKALGPYGDRVVPYGPVSVEKLRSKTLTEKKAILHGLMEYADLVEPIIQEDPTVLHDEVRLLRQVISQLHLVVDEKIYEDIQKDYIVEIYNTDFVQVYRSLSFMNLCNYNFLDLLTHEFYELYERSVSINEHLFKACGVLASSGNFQSIDLSSVIPKHLMRENFSEEKGVFQIEFLKMYPVYRWPREFYGYLVIQRAQVCPEPTSDCIRFL